MTRLPDWQNRLTAYLSGVRALPFEWGRHDCALFAAGAVQAMTGEDLARGWRGYRSHAAGAKKLRQAGYVDHVALAAALLPEVPPAAALPGDVAVLQIDTQEQALGIVQGRMIYAVSPSGLGLVPRARMLRAFRV